jgi:transmembrane sensor
MERFDDGTQFSIREHAAQWFLRLHAHDLSVAERFAYLQWLKASPVHIGETLQICRLYSILYPMKQQLSFTNEDPVSNVIELPREDGAASPSRTRSSWHIRALIAVLAIGMLLFAGSIARRTWLAPTIETQASQWRSLALNDGGVVSVGPLNRVQLVVAPALSSQRMFGQFHADDPASFAESVAVARKGVVVHPSPDVILLQPVGQPR